MSFSLIIEKMRQLIINLDAWPSHAFTKLSTKTGMGIFSQGVFVGV